MITRGSPPSFLEPTFLSADLKRRHARHCLFGRARQLSIATQLVSSGGPKRTSISPMLTMKRRHMLCEKPNTAAADSRIGGLEGAWLAGQSSHMFVPSAVTMNGLSAKGALVTTQHLHALYFSRHSDCTSLLRLTSKAHLCRSYTEDSLVPTSKRRYLQGAALVNRSCTLVAHNDR